MKRSAVLLAMLTLAFAAGAVPVTVDQAKLAARAWVARGGTLGARLGTTVSDAATLAVTSSVASVDVHAVAMKGGGTVFFASDTTREPVIAFTSATNAISSIDKKGPLWALLCRDAAVRGGRATTTNAAATSSSTASSGSSNVKRALTAASPTSSSAMTKAESTWAALLAEGEALERKDAAAAAAARSGLKFAASASRIESEGDLGDLRVSPLVKSKWDQENVGGEPCYNYYAPVLKTGKRAQSGCVATAMAQILRLHEFPRTAREPAEYECYVNTYLATKARDLACVTNLTTMAGVYDWSSMPLEPGADLTDAQRQAIGKLIYDAGVSAHMNYGVNDEGTSGAFSFNAAVAFKEAFGYANADYFAVGTNDDITTYRLVMKRGLFANLDAGYPVLMGITGDAGGHAVVGDGYGYNDEALYVHLNMGWSGLDDYWYNLPTVDACYNFTVFDDLVCNIFPEMPSENAALLTGRVVDSAGDGVSGASVSVSRVGRTVLFTNVVTSATGVYGCLVPAGSCVVDVSAAGHPETGTGDSAIVLSQTKTSSTEMKGVILDDGKVDWVEEFYGISRILKSSSMGNSWENDFTLADPCARIVSDAGATTNWYATLDDAFDAAKAVAGSSAVIELLADATLDSTTQVTTPCVLTTAAAASSPATVTRTGTAAFAVASGATLALSNVTFAAASSPVVTVAAGGRLALGANVDFGVAVPTAAVKTTDADGLVLADAPTSAFAISCSSATQIYDAFGTATCPAAAATTGAAKIVNADDATLVAFAESDEGTLRLKWDETAVAEANAAATFVDKSGATVTASTLDRALAKYVRAQSRGEVLSSQALVVRGGVSQRLATRRTIAAGTVTLCGETAGTTIADFAASAGFDVGEGATLTVRDLTLSNYVDGANLFVVDGGTLNLESVAIADATGTNSYSAAVVVKKGLANLKKTRIANCALAGRVGSKSFSTYGGGATVLGEGSLTLVDSVVTNCTATTAGGGVYAAAGASVSLSGACSILGNRANTATDNLHLVESTKASASLALADVVTGGIGVAWDSATRAAAGGAFATGATSVLKNSATAFSNDKDAALEAQVYAAAGATDGSLVWMEPASTKEVDSSVAFVATVDAAGARRYYATISDAISMLADGDATIELLNNDVLREDVTIAGGRHVTLKSAGGAWSLTQALGGTNAIFVADGASLTITNATLAGTNDGGCFLDVNGGALTLLDGAKITNVVSFAARPGAVYVHNRGSITMESGAEIVCNQNLNYVSAVRTGKGGGLELDAATACLRGGVITGCTSWDGAGVKADNGSEVYVSGDVKIVDNAGLVAAKDNLNVSDDSTLYLDGVLTGSVGWTAGYGMKNMNVFGRVASTFGGTDAQLANSAHKFTNDQTGDVGLAVESKTGSDDKLLVWSNALDVDGNVVVNGTNYVMITGAGVETLNAEIMGATTNLVYNGQAQTPTIEGHGYVVSCDSQTNVGSYTATLELKKGFLWGDGTTAAKTIDWSIEKATYDMTGIKFANATVEYDGKAHSIKIDEDTLPKGVTVSYTGNGRTDVGTYTITATFAIEDPENYNAIAPMKATLTITEKPAPTPEPEPEPTVVTPTPIAFQSIERLSENSWRLVVTNRVAWCWYRLLSTDDLAKGFTTTNEWVQAPADATPAWTNDVTTATEALFWRAEGKEGIRGE